MHDDHTVIGKSLFKKETKMEAFMGLKVNLSTGMQYRCKFLYEPSILNIRTAQDSDRTYCSRIISQLNTKIYSIQK